MAAPTPKFNAEVNQSMPANTPKSNFSLKDKLVNRGTVKMVAELLAAAVPNFDSDAFVKETVRPFSSLELKQRITHLATTLDSFLDSDFRIAATQITDALPPPLDPSLTDDDFGEFIYTAFGEYVVRKGLAKKQLATSLRTLKEITKRCTSEYAIRHFLNEYPDQTIATLQRWTADKNYHVRRLVSEGTRPKLPWGCAISIDPTSVLPLLTKLHADPTRYVTRSVSNHLNDLSKIAPEETISLLKDWVQQGRQKPAELKWMCNHALRTLIKQGDANAMRLLGFRKSPKISIQNFRLARTTLKIGDSLDFDFDLHAQRREKLILDYVIYFPTVNGNRKPKVHKIKQIEITADQKRSIRKSHLFKSNSTTYRIHPGTHQIALQINGTQTERLTFELL